MVASPIPPCPPCPKCWSSDSVSFVSVSDAGSYCKCQRCANVWLHDGQQIAALLRDAGMPSRRAE